MTETRHTVTIEAPISAVYQQWLDVESFPEIVPTVQEATVTADFYSHWTLSIGRITRAFDAEITEQLPEEKVAWRSLTGDVTFTGTATFKELGPDQTNVTVTLTWTPTSAAERAAIVLRADRRALRDALNAFKTFLETNGGPTGHSYITLPALDADSATPTAPKPDAPAAPPTLRRARHVRD